MYTSHVNDPKDLEADGDGSVNTITIEVCDSMILRCKNVAQRHKVI